MDFILQPWAWYVGGPLIAISLLLYFYFGKNFGASTNFETLCTMAGAGKVSDYFKKDWKDRDFALLFVIGLIIGGFISSLYLIPNQTIDLNPKTVQELTDLGFSNIGSQYFPEEIFGEEAMINSSKIDLMIELVDFKDSHNYERLGYDTSYTEILDIKIPHMKIPVSPGRNLSTLIEIAVKKTILES